MRFGFLVNLLRPGRRGTPRVAGDTSHGAGGESHRALQPFPTRQSSVIKLEQALSSALVPVSRRGGCEHEASDKAATIQLRSPPPSAS